METFLLQLPPVEVIGIMGKYIPVDLSAINPQLARLESSRDFETHIEKYLAGHHAIGAWGGYNEVRNLYRRSGIFNNQGSEERNIHIGIDIWTKAGTPVLAALDGKIHSFDCNAGIGNYGPTIILEHHIDGFKFFTLYGHLSLESIENIEVGDTFQQGKAIGTLGSAAVNGDYAPHLHFQIIKNIGNHFGDYPGVCSQSDREYFLDNCPDPNLLLKLK